MPTYNREACLREGAESVFAQTYDRWELLIVDDGSTDGTRAYLKTLRDPRVRCILREHSGNAALLRNMGVRAARGSHIAFLDSDDLWLPEKLTLQVEDLRAQPQCGWSYTGFAFIDEQKREIPWGRRPRWQAHRGWIVHAVADSQSIIHTSTVMVERRLLESVGGLDESLMRCELHDLSIRLAEASPATVVPAPLVQVRQHPGNRRTDWLDVLVCLNRVYSGAIARTASAPLRRTCRRQRARASVEFVGKARGAGRYADARQALWTSFRYAWWCGGWWAALLKTWLRPAIPGGVLSLYQRLKHVNQHA